ncbi:hypothetical protein CANCADRAFT_2769 [Tortispora caseinolytica NRRL Y-17796]|uniref:Sec39 domain-containing protein n=1 Tax=Tortispora caseinolytica NRRL Y-17796 TaxID=767744 RepID=A0A1E4TH13_9ASCO|nr:hypothetical protein CANCADRAFT_2769 [Tortispora caseinolytica NRRL Y-17796]
MAAVAFLASKGHVKSLRILLNRSDFQIDAQIVRDILLITLPLSVPPRLYMDIILDQLPPYDPDVSNEVDNANREIDEALALTADCDAPNSGSIANWCIQRARIYCKANMLVQASEVANFRGVPEETTEWYTSVLKPYTYIKNDVAPHMTLSEFCDLAPAELVSSLLAHTSASSVCHDIENLLGPALKEDYSELWNWLESASASNDALVVSLARGWAGPPTTVFKNDYSSFLEKFLLNCPYDPDLYAIIERLELLGVCCSQRIEELRAALMASKSLSELGDVRDLQEVLDMKNWDSKRQWKLINSI